MKKEHVFFTSEKGLRWFICLLGSLEEGKVGSYASQNIWLEPLLHSSLIKVEYSALMRKSGEEGRMLSRVLGSFRVGHVRVTMSSSPVTILSVVGCLQSNKTNRQQLITILSQTLPHTYFCIAVWLLWLPHTSVGSGGRNTPSGLSDSGLACECAATLPPPPPLPPIIFLNAPNSLPASLSNNYTLFTIYIIKNNAIDGLVQQLILVMLVVSFGCLVTPK